MLHGLSLPCHVYFPPFSAPFVAWRPTSEDFPSGFQGSATGGRCRKTGDYSLGFLLLPADLLWLHSSTKDHRSCCAPIAAISFVFLGVRMGKAFPVASPSVLPLPLLVSLNPAQIFPSGSFIQLSLAIPIPGPRLLCPAGILTFIVISQNHRNRVSSGSDLP